MYIQPSDYGKVFKEIKRTSLSHSTCKLIIFVSCLSIDSLCSAKILSVLLKKELIQYQLIPVVGYSDLKVHFKNLDIDVSNVILIGCGAMLDLESFFEIDLEDYEYKATTVEDDGELSKIDKIFKSRLKRRIFIIDGHRPWNLDNIFGSSAIICFDDGFIDRNLNEESEAFKILSQIEEDESDVLSAEESDLEAEELLDEQSTDADEKEQGSQSGTPKKRRKREREERKMKKQRRADISHSEDIVDAYYNQGTTISSSTTATIYGLLSIIGETSIENLWLAIIGTSSLDNRYPEVYDRIQPLYKDEVLRLSPSANLQNEKTADTTSLDISKDYHLFLLRHWTLYDSFLYSSQVNAKLNLWTEEGKKKLHKLFAKMGVSLAIAKQKWLYMDISIKKQLPFIFNKYLPLYGLEGIVRDGFIRTFGYTGQLSAMESVEALTALLELDKRLLDKDSAITDQNIDDDDFGSDGNIIAQLHKKEKIWVSNFWISWDALSMEATRSNTSWDVQKSRGLTLLLQGLEHAKQIQQIIFKTGVSVLERKLIKNLRLYRLCVLKSGSIPDLEIFSNPLMLSKLGSWLLDNITEIDFVNNNRSLRPLIVASLNVSSDVYLVIGLVPKYPRGMNSINEKRGSEAQETVSSTTRLNTFSVAFQQVASTSGAKVRIDSFDSSVIEIRREDLSPFLEKLTLSGLI
ncbi:uncharacterized protein PRCAT00003608001 [Priceomyces carsonii]|uniref:uncharacterized protein n=1 Tax=Priceomyces carsonii TaxID=28549 RepID=UPI002ED9FF19|nr:unnamed protein product [Priceomyces carsonii]